MFGFLVDFHVVIFPDCHKEHCVLLLVAGSLPGCQACVKEQAERLSTPKRMDLPFYKAHDGIPDPVVGVRHHHFLDRYFVLFSIFFSV